MKKEKKKKKRRKEKNLAGKFVKSQKSGLTELGSVADAGLADRLWLTQSVQIDGRMQDKHVMTACQTDSGDIG